MSQRLDERRLRGPLAPHEAVQVGVQRQLGIQECLTPCRRQNPGRRDGRELVGVTNARLRVEERLAKPVERVGADLDVAELRADLLERPGIRRLDAGVRPLAVVVARFVEQRRLVEAIVHRCGVLRRLHGIRTAAVPCVDPRLALEPLKNAVLAIDVREDAQPPGLFLDEGHEL